MGNGAPHQEESHKRGLGARLAVGLIVLALLLLFGSLIKTHLADPALSVWEPIFSKAFGAPTGYFGGIIPKFWSFILFSFVATLGVAYIIETAINARWFSIQGILFRKIPFLKHLFSFIEGSAFAYRNLKRARSVYLRVATHDGEVFVPAFITRELVICRGGARIPCFVVYCPHTPTFLTGNTFVISKRYARDGGVIDVPATMVTETVLSAGIFGKPEEIEEELERSQS